MICGTISDGLYRYDLMGGYIEMDFISSIFAGVIGSTVGAFLGFVGAFYLQHKADNRSKKNRDELILRNIKDEISDISSSLSKYLEKEVPLNYNIPTPNWYAALYSGSILEFIENPVYSQTINLYSQIGHFNSMRTSLSKEDNVSSIKDIVATINCIINHK